MTNLSNLLRDRKGATAVEYCLIAALISICAVSVIGEVGNTIGNTFSTVHTVLDRANQIH